MTVTRVQFIDDDPDMCALVHDQLVASGFDVHCHIRAEDALVELRETDFDVIIADVNLKQESGLEFCRKVKENRPHTPVILVTGYGTMNTAIDAIRAGAVDFWNKPFDHDALSSAVRGALQRRVPERLDRLRAEERRDEGREETSPFLGESLVMRQVYELIRRVAPTDATVLFGGESGTGKELAARALHAASRRAALPFVAINCAAVSPHLIESELFGHVKGSFTDAKESRRGLFESAGEGTVLLDEIGEMPLDMQPKLLRALQERQVRPVGGNTTLPFRARVVTATHRDLEKEVVAGRFRKDLYYRLNVVQIDLPPLRERGNDIATLARHFVSKFGKQPDRTVTGISEQAMRSLMQYDWPGNVRELENTIQRAVALARGEQIEPEDLTERIRLAQSAGPMLENATSTCSIPLDEVERRHIQRVLLLSKGNKTKAAKALGVDRRTLYRKLEAFEALGKVPSGPS